MFNIMDMTSGRHQSAYFYAGVMYPGPDNNTRKTFNLLSNVRHGTNTFSAVRFVYSTSDMYATVYLEVYVENASNNSVRYIMSDNDINSGWTAVDWTAGSIPSGYSDIQYAVTSIDMNIKNNFVINTSGNVGIGTTNPGSYKLYVEGTAKISGDLTLGSGDVSEYFSADKEYPLGTVLVMADGKAKSVKACDEAYDRGVVGVLSTDPAINIGEKLGLDESDKKVPIAMSGVVPVRVNESNGPIVKGDLLTTSGVEGEAMKASDLIVGAIIGKALEDSSSDKNSILTLVNLQ